MAEIHNEFIKNQEEISLKEIIQKLGDWWNYLKTQWFKIAIVGFIGGFSGFVYSWMQPITYSAKMTFIVEESKSASSSLGGLSSLAGQFGVDIGGGGSSGILSGDNILAYFKSPALAREVLLSTYNEKGNLSIADAYVQAYHLRDDWDKKNIGILTFSPSTEGIIYTRLQDSLIQVISRKIIKDQFSIAKADKKASFIEVETIFEDELLAKAYCEKIVEIAVKKYLLVKTKRQQVTVDNLQKRVDSIADLLNNKTVISANLQTSNSTMDINPLYKTNTTIINETTSRDKLMLGTIFGEVTKNLELAKFTLSQETPVIQVIDPPVLPLQKNKLSKLLLLISGSLLGLIFATLYYTLKLQLI
ncbi:hypothetical protein [Flavobacterium sp.]|uniref:hypothetical protein n=1 Tax=Flavobacterium sp. TaxID=239 RepID=UPI003BD0D007